MKRLIIGLIVVLACVFCSRKTAVTGEGRSTASVMNDTTKDVMVFVSFGSDSAVLAADWVSFAHVASKLTCDFPLKAGSAQPLPLAGKYLNATFAFGAAVGCDVTKAELNINNPKWYDIADVSLVDGYSNEVEIDVAKADASTKTALGPPHGRDNNEKVFGLYPYGCDICTARQNPPCGIVPGGTGCKGGTQYKPDVPCQYQGGVMGGDAAYEVKLVKLVPLTL